MQAGAIGRNERDAQRGAERIARARAASLQRRERRAGEVPDLECALNPLRVRRFQSRCRLWINPRKLRMQRGPTFTRGTGIDLRPQLPIGGRQCGQAFGERFEVEHCAAGEDRHTAAAADVRDRPKRVVRERRGGISLRRIDDVDQVMRDATA